MPEDLRRRAGGGRVRRGSVAAPRRLILLLVPALLAAPVHAGAEPPRASPTEQLQAQQRRIDAAIVAPCKSEQRSKAAQIRQSISQCPCSDAQKQQETGELEAALAAQLRACEQQGADALDQYKRAMIARAQDDFIRLGAQVELDRQILRNLGFDQSVAEMEAWTQYGEEAQRAYTRGAQNEVIGKFLQALQLKAAAAAATPQMSSQQAVSLYNLFKATGVKDPALFDALAAAGRGDPQIPERMLWVQVTDGLGKLNKARTIIQTDDQAASIFRSMLDVAGWIAPELAPALSIVKDAMWIGYATYSHAEVAYGRYRVDRLTTLDEAQLRTLEPVTRRLKQDVDGLVATKRFLQSAGIDSTTLVRRPAE